MTKQELFYFKLKDMGGRASSQEMMKELDEKGLKGNWRINNIARNLVNRGLLKTEKIKIDGARHRPCNFFIALDRKNKPLVRKNGS